MAVLAVVALLSALSVAVAGLARSAVAWVDGLAGISDGGAALPSLSQDARYDSSAPTSTEVQMFNLVNRDRALRGLTTLEFDDETLALARERADAQRAQQRLTHRSDSGQLNFAAGLAARGVPYQIAAENLARVPVRGSGAPEAAQLALMGSEQHRIIILHAAFDRLAVGSTVDTLGQTVFAQIFRAVGPVQASGD